MKLLIIFIVFVVWSVLTGALWPLIVRASEASGEWNSGQPPK